MHLLHGQQEISTRARAPIVTNCSDEKMLKLDHAVLALATYDPTRPDLVIEMYPVCP